ncbi:hypothetical protein GCK32_021982 [Trichostrongylus colubriformis]|uniref:ShKT domain-containing protein n=1 Tax=Trichostrongylus colubriformis TaxID=6319 RepID=A0AAN8IES7_TRICO
MMWLHYFLCLAFLFELTDTKAFFTKLSPKILETKKKNEKVTPTNEVIQGKDEMTALKKDDNPKKGSADAPWCLDAIDEWECKDYKDMGLCENTHEKYYFMCEKTCSNGTCNSVF